ncbi:cyclic nucleotide-binding domain-containing protein [Nisaea sp.]|uniref:cyclic nucleotide-binding domain-containing protein n=1 Tax=Nisaea sp. TaxID=2024842 RepID=UPI003B52F0EC
MNGDNRSQIEFPDGAVLMRPGAEPEFLYLIRSGHVVLDPVGIDRRLMFGPGTVIGLAWLIDNTIATTYRSEITAVGPVTAERLDASLVKEQLKGLSPRMRVCLISMIRQINMTVETENQSDSLLARLLKKSSRELDSLLARQSADTGELRVDPLADALEDVQRTQRRGRDV